MSATRRLAVAAVALMLATSSVRAEHYFQTDVGLIIVTSENFRSAGEVTYYEYNAAGWQTPRRAWTTYLRSIESPFPGNIGSCYVAHISAYEPGIQGSASQSSPICLYGPIEQRPPLSQ